MMQEAFGSRRITVTAFAAAFFAALSFALYTNIAWDDWFITYKTSKNLAIGNGLVYSLGEHVQSFTSPLGTLVPAFLNIITFNSSDGLVLWLFRIISAAALGFACIMLLKFGRNFRLHAWALFVLIGLTISDAKILTHSIDGMETAFVMFFLALNLYALSLPQDRRSIILLGFAWGGLMWTRPDGFVYAVALCSGWFIFRPGSMSGVNRLVILRSWSLSGLIALVLYVPWLVWAFGYFGSFIPHTIIAKGYTLSTAMDGGFVAIVGRFIESAIRFISAGGGAFKGTFVPSYGATFGGWPLPLVLFSRALAWTCAFLWVLPFVSAGVRALSLAACIGQLYLGFGMEYAFPWYFPPVTVLSICVFAFAIDAGLRYAAGIDHRDERSFIGSKLATNAIKAIAGAPIIISCIVSLATAVQLRAYENIIYLGNTKLIGEWLREHALSPRDTVFLEPLGYIGFYSNLKMYDYPGLSSDEMIKARKAFPPSPLNDRRAFADLIPYMKPDWIVLRPFEIAAIEQVDPTVLTEMYKAVQEFDVTQRVASAELLPGRPCLFFDQKFTVYHRRPL